MGVLLARPRPGWRRGRCAGRRALACLLLSGCLLAACDSRLPSAGGPTAVASTPKPASVLDVPPARMRAGVLEPYRLTPDRRFLAAVAEVHSLLTGQDRQAVAAEFRDGRWQVRYRGTDVGTLPELPDFPDFLGLVSAWAGRLAEPRPASGSPSGPGADLVKDAEREIAEFLAPHLVAALDRLDQAWRRGHRDPALFRAASRALVRLSLQSLDIVEMADAVPARALAVLALAHRLGGDPMSREASLLARVTGYDAEAARLATSLPADDPVRLYVVRDDERLREIAERDDASVEARYLQLLRLGEARDVERWSRWRDAHFRGADARLPALRAGLELDRFAPNAELSRTLWGAVLQDLTGQSGQRSAAGLRWERLRRSVGQTLAVLWALAEHVVRERLGRPRTEPPRLGGPWLRLGLFEATLADVAGSRAGPFWDAGIARGYYRGQFYSALHVLGLHELDARSSIEDARELAAALGEPGAGPAADFARWYQHLAEFKAAGPDPRRLLDDLEKLPALGARPLTRTFEELDKHVAYGAPLRFAGVRRLVARLDTRMRHRVYLGHLAHTVLRDLALAERLYRSIAEAAPAAYPFTQAWYLMFTGQDERLEALRQSRIWSPETRAEILRRLEQRLEPPRLRAEYRRLIDEAPDRWRLRSQYVDYLERTKQYDEARGVIGEWLERHDDSAGFDYIFARTALARMHYRSGRYAEGWAAIEPVVDSNQAGAVGRAALLLEGLGRSEDAVRLGRSLVATYPDLIRGRGVLAELHWRGGRDDEAARVLKASPRKLSATDWSETIGPAFAEVFGARPPKAARAAFGALLAQGVSPFELRELAAAVAAAGNQELGFELASLLRGAGLSDIAFRVRAYRHLKVWKGREAAVGWLRQAVPPALANPSAMLVFDEEEDDLLWDLIAEPDAGEHPAFVWLLRAAAWVRAGSPADARGRALAEHYRGAGSGHYHALGRFLLGLEPEGAVLALATDPKKRCEVPYYVGLRAQAEGRYADASDWFRVAVETGQDKNGEYAWAYRALARWERTGKSLTRLAAEKG